MCIFCQECVLKIRNAGVEALRLVDDGLWEARQLRRLLGLLGLHLSRFCTSGIFECCFIELGETVCKEKRRHALFNGAQAGYPASQGQNLVFYVHVRWTAACWRHCWSGVAMFHCEWGTTRWSTWVSLTRAKTNVGTPYYIAPEQVFLSSCSFVAQKWT